MTNIFLLAESSKNNDLSWAVDIFTFIGIAVCIVVTLIALVWLTCFVVRLLVKSFKFKIEESYGVMAEDIKKKAESKKERKALKRKTSDEQKMEILNMKLESSARVHEMKKQKLQSKLDEVENTQRVKLFGEPAEVVPHVEEKPAKKFKKEEPKQVENTIQETEDKENDKEENA